VAVTNTDEIVYASFAIEKMETDENGDLVVHGKASDGNLDSDNQIVDPAWMAKAAADWLATGGNVRVQHNPQRDPAGVGVKAETDRDGATWVTAKVFEPVAQKLVSKGALRAYSVGIARPSIVRDASAPGGRIVGGELVEISLVDRPANKRCGIQLVKSVDGSAEYTGEVFGSEEDISKALGAEVSKSSGVPIGLEGWTPEVGTDDMTFTFTPNDLAKILKSKFIEQHYEELALEAVKSAEVEIYKRDIDTATRRRLASEGKALPNLSYPIENAGDLGNAATLARSGHGDVGAARRLISRRAKELGVTNPLESDDKVKKNDEVVLPENEIVVKTDTETVDPVESVKEADPEVTKDPADGDGKGKKAKGKKLPPWLQDKGDDAKADASKAADTDDDAAEKCAPSGTPQSTSGASDAAPMNEIPNKGPAPESPMPAGRKTPDTKGEAAPEIGNPEVAAMLRFKTIGIDPDLGRLHDLTCPAFHPDEVSKYHPYADFKTVIDTGMWQRKAVDAACGPLDKAVSLTQVWQAAETLKSSDLAELNDYRMELYKAFRDANPGPSSYPSPGCISPDKFNRPVLTGGHSSNGSGYDGPNSSPNVASSDPSASHFDRPPLESGHQSPSPSFMKATWDVPSENGVPQRLQFAQLEKERARIALSMMHDHLAHAFPLSCPMLDQDAYRVNNPTTNVPATEGISTGGVSKSDETVETVTELVVKSEADIAKGMRKKLGKKVLAGKMTVDEARSKMGRVRAQKVDDKEDLVKSLFDKGVITRDEALKILGIEVPVAAPEVAKTAPVSEPVVEAKGYDPELIKSAVSEAVAPFLAELNKAKEKIESQQEIIEKMADQPDPSSAVFTGLAMNPVRKSASPAGVPSQADIAERTQQMMIRQLTRIYNTSENPMERESAFQALEKFRGIE
jgi:hypothetical protein